MQITIAKFHLYPEEAPNSYAVGFNVTASNGRSFYTDTIIPLTETQGKTDDQIVSMAYEHLQQGITDRVTTLEQRSPILGTGWTPPDGRLPDDPEQPIEDDLESVKARAKRQIEHQTQRFIDTQPDGTDRYKWFQGLAFLNTKFSLMSIPEDQRTQPIIDVLSRILEVEVWQASVYQYHYSVVSSIMALETVEEVRDIKDEFTLDQFNITDPGMSLTEIMFLY